MSTAVTLARPRRGDRRDGTGAGWLILASALQQRLAIAQQVPVAGHESFGPAPWPGAWACTWGWAKRKSCLQDVPRAGSVPPQIGLDGAVDAGRPVEVGRVAVTAHRQQAGVAELRTSFRAPL